MDSKRIGWSTRLTQRISKFPPDVTFKFPEGDVHVHKMVLAMASNVFRDMFVNERDYQMFMEVVREDTNKSSFQLFHNLFLDKSVNETSSEDTINTSFQSFQNLFLNKAITEISMECTTKSSFQVIIDAIYDVKPVKESLREKTFHEMFAVLYLVTKYEIPELVLSVKEAISCFPVKNVISDSNENSGAFMEHTRNVLIACAKYLKPQIDDDGLLRFVAVNADNSPMEDEPNIQKCFPCFSILPMEIKEKILNYLCDNAALVSATVCLEWSGILIKKLMGQCRVIFKEICGCESSNGLSQCLLSEEMRMGFQMLIEKLQSDSEESKVEDMEVNYVKISYNLSKDLANALCRMKTVWLGSDFPLNKVMVRQVLENIQTRAISLESLSFGYFCDWRDLLKPADLIALANKMKAFVLVENFTPDQIEAAKYLAGVKVGYNMIYKR